MPGGRARVPRRGAGCLSQATIPPIPAVSARRDSDALDPPLATTYRQHAAATPWKLRVRAVARDAAVAVLSSFGDVPATRHWIRFPYYHHVYQDERAGFDRHLRFMRNLGEFVSIDQAVSLLDGDLSLDGRYFCITFDDGFRSCLDGAVPLLVDHRAPAAFFVPTAFIGKTVERDAGLLRSFYPDRRLLVEFLTWAECRQMAAAGMTIGSHTVSHACLSALSTEEVQWELRESRATIERELGMPCEHFACPFGRAGMHFLPERDPAAAAREGYRSFLTAERGSSRRTSASLYVERDHLLAGWGTHNLRYFFSR